LSSGQQTFEVSDLAPKAKWVEVPPEWVIGAGPVIFLIIQIQLKGKYCERIRQKYNLDHAKRQLFI
jgi:hypothetical protein